jgi:hypothetical protein
MFEALRIIAQSDFIPERSIHFIAYAAGQMNFGKISKKLNYFQRNDRKR